MAERDYKKMPTEVLEKLIEQGTIERDPAMYELQRRLSKPHWSVVPAFWVAILAMIFASIAAWPVVRAFFQASPSWDKAASSQPLQSQSTPSEPPEPKTSASSNLPSEPPN